MCYGQESRFFVSRRVVSFPLFFFLFFSFFNLHVPWAIF